MHNNQYRQGDVLITPATIPPTAKRQVLPHIVLAKGEVTGHCHQVKAPVGKCTLYIDDQRGEQVLYLEVRQLTPVEHEEHGTVQLEPGKYVVREQVEYWLDEVRQVMD
jgi:hypothetical protein